MSDTTKEHPPKASALKKARRAIREKMVAYVAAAFGLVAALAWNEAIKELIDSFVPDTNSILAKMIYAVVITLVVGIILYVLEKSNEEDVKPTV